MMNRTKLGTAMGTILIVALLTAIAWASDPISPVLEDEEFPWLNVDPNDYPGRTYLTAELALIEANSQLASMQHGNMETIDGNSYCFSGNLTKVPSMGNKIVWCLADEDVTIWIDAFDEEIIHYFRAGSFSGSITGGQADQEILGLVTEFATLPNDADNGFLIERTIHEDQVYDPTDDSWDTTEVSYWTHTYTRVKNTIDTTDTIYTVLHTDGTCAYYYKNWWMPIGQLSTEYTVTQQEAEDEAVEYIGVYNVSLNTRKLVTRPNAFYNYEDDIVLTFTAAPQAVWEVVVTLEPDEFSWLFNGTQYDFTFEGNWVYTIHIHKDSGDIVGGDWMREPTIPPWLDGMPEEYRWD